MEENTNIAGTENSATDTAATTQTNAPSSATNTSTSTDTSLQKQLLDAGVHFGHLRKKWNPKMKPYIYDERKGLHIIDLNKTVQSLDEAAAVLKSIAKAGKKIMFVATKKQAKEIVTEAAQRVNMPYVTERWLGGMLTNFNTIRKSVKKMQGIDKLLNDPNSENLNKKERLTLTRERDKMEKVLGGVTQLTRLPAALFIVDISHEHIALAEATKLNITTVGMVDTNSDPTKVDYAIPSNDDATKSIAVVVNYITAAIAQGLEERQALKDEEDTADHDDNAEAEARASRFEKSADAGTTNSDGSASRKPGGAAAGGRRPRTGGGAGSRTGGNVRR